MLINELLHQIHSSIFAVTQFLYFLEIRWSGFLLYFAWNKQHRAACWAKAFFVTTRTKQLKAASLHVSQWVLAQKSRYVRFFLHRVLTILFDFHEVDFLFWSEISWLFIVYIVISGLVGFHKIVLRWLVALTHSGMTTDRHEFGRVWQFSLAWRLNGMLVDLILFDDQTTRHFTPIDALRALLIFIELRTKIWFKGRGW